MKQRLKEQGIGFYGQGMKLFKQRVSVYMEVV
jgi:hypothetical protein